MARGKAESVTRVLFAFVLGSLGWTAAAFGQQSGAVAGQVTLAATGDPVHGAIVLVIGPGLVTQTGNEGRFEITGIAPGTYEVLAQREHLTAERKTVTIEPGATAELDFVLSLSAIHEEINVTASPTGATAFEAFNAVTTLDSIELAKQLEGSIGQVLADEPGIAKRSFGPGSSRPIIRGFDGDRVLIMQDGVRTGDLSSQSGDHGVTIDPGGLERIEVVRGPATLLYGSNAVGGVVNAITPHDAFRKERFEGVRGQLTTDGGTADEQAGLNGNLLYGNDRWLFWGGGGARRTDDYATPVGDVLNSASRLANGRAGGGYFGDRAFLSLGYEVEDGRYGVPFAGALHAHGEEEEDEPHLDELLPSDEAEELLLVDIDTSRSSLRFDGGVQNLQTPWVETVRFTANYLDWRHRELEILGGAEEVGTVFDNETLVLRADVDQKAAGRLSGSFGVSTELRDFIATGEEALAPPTEQRTLSAFAYEQLNFGRYRVQFGARVEHNRFDASARGAAHEEAEDHGDEGPDALEPPAAVDRSFTGVSASVGLHADVGATGAFVANLTRSYRSPALEELYNFGPHAGNQAFEVGNPELEREAITGVDVSLRHRSDRFRGELNTYYYAIDNFVFPAFTDLELDGLRVAFFLQGNSRFTGFDGRADLQLHDHLWLKAGVGFVSARLTSLDEALPRIPPLQGTFEVEIPYGGFTITPELVLAARQDEVFRQEEPTPGYGVLNLTASYFRAGAHAAHIFTVKAYNLTDQTYRLHTSFIKDLAPEIGRGIRATYSLRFF